MGTKTRMLTFKKQSNDSKGTPGNILPVFPGLMRFFRKVYKGVTMEDHIGSSPKPLIYCFYICAMI